MAGDLHHLAAALHLTDQLQALGTEAGDRNVHLTTVMGSFFGLPASRPSHSKPALTRPRRLPPARRPAARQQVEVALVDALGPPFTATPYSSL